MNVVHSDSPSMGGQPIATLKVWEVLADARKRSDALSILCNRNGNALSASVSDALYIVRRIHIHHHNHLMPVLYTAIYTSDRRKH